MYIQWFGLSCFKIQTKEAVIFIDPFSQKAGLKPPRFKADILLISRDEEEHNNRKAALGQPYVIDSPGEYELKNVFIFGIPNFQQNGKEEKRKPLTIFLLQSEEMSLAHLSDISQVPSEKNLEKLEGVDILLVPVGGKKTLDAAKAAKLISEIEPRIVIPMHYKTPGLKLDLEGIDKFAREMGLKKEEVFDKLKIEKKNLPQEETKIYLLKP